MHHFLERVEKKTGIRFETVPDFLQYVNTANVDFTQRSLPYNDILIKLLSDPTHFQVRAVKPLKLPLFTPHEQRVLTKRAAENASLETVGKTFHISRDKVTAIEAKAFNKVRHFGPRISTSPDTASNPT